MELKVQPNREEIKDGLHEGIIIDVEYRNQPYEYTDVVIEFGGYKLKAGYPTLLAEKSKLGALMARFGATLNEGNMLDPNKVLVGKKCQFLTITETTKRGNFAKIMPESVKPAKEIKK